MFLNQLEAGNKEAFLKLCVFASLSNGVFADEEKKMIFAYCREMNIVEQIPTCTESLEDVLSELSKNASDTEKNIITLEILGLVKADGSYDSSEKDFMTKLVTGMNVKDNILSKIDSLLEIYTAVCKELYSTISNF